MSMLSAQCDELREVATRYDELQVGAVKAVTMPSNMGSILREAADTIWELRCKLSDMVDERERARVAEAENAKLRELVEAMPYCMEGKCLACPLCSYFEPALGNVPECEALPILHALGIYGDDEDKLGVTPF